MRQQTILLICASGIIFILGTSACCLNCPNPPKGGTAAYSHEEADPLSQPSGEDVNGVRVIKMTAKKFKFEPSLITVRQGDKVRLEITSLDVKHGFALKEYKIDRTLEPGKTQIIEFTAEKSGEFNFHCSVFCGMGHLGMKGRLIVEPK